MAGRATVIAVVDAVKDPAHTGPLVWWVETDAGSSLGQLGFLAEDGGCG